MFMNSIDYSFWKFLEAKRYSKEQSAYIQNISEICTSEYQEYHAEFQIITYKVPKLSFKSFLPTNHLSCSCCNQSNIKTAE